MSGYGHIGYRSLGTPELQPTDYETETDYCDDCDQQTLLIDLEHDQNETGGWRCADCQENEPTREIRC